MNAPKTLFFIKKRTKRDREFEGFDPYANFNPYEN